MVLDDPIGDGGDTLGPVVELGGGEKAVPLFPAPPVLLLVTARLDLRALRPEVLDRKGIKAAAAIWITGALGLAIATSYWPLGLVAGAITALILFVADSFPDEVREEKQEP